MNDLYPDHDDEKDIRDMRVQQAAQQFTYPPTPDIAGRLYQSDRHVGISIAFRRTIQVVVAMVLMIMLSILIVPEIRASVLELLRIGSVRVLQGEPTAIPEISQTPGPKTVLDLPNETTLGTAREHADFPITLPGYPADAGLPDHVYIQDDRSDLVSLVWMKHEQPDEVWFSLHIMNSDGFAEKSAVRNVHETTVNGQWAVWLVQPHLIEFELGSGSVSWYIQDHVLLWETDRITYRLETDLPLEEARRIAESLDQLER
jgi:hypothetical protein